MSEQADLTVPEWTVGDRLRKARVHAGIGTEQMAVALLRTRNTVGNYEGGRSKPPPRVMARWAELCAVPLEWLLTGDTSSPGPDPGPGTRRRRTPPGTRTQNLRIKSPTL